MRWNELLSMYKCFKGMTSYTATPARCFLAKTMGHKRAALTLFSCWQLTVFRSLRKVPRLEYNFRPWIVVVVRTALPPSDRGKRGGSLCSRQNHPQVECCDADHPLIAYQLAPAGFLYSIPATLTSCR